jgi:hypothetical protein
MSRPFAADPWAHIPATTEGSDSMHDIVQPPAGAERIATVKDPSLAYQRRYFSQPATGPGRRAFTAAGAARQHRRNRRPSLFARFKRKWDEAVERENQSRRYGVLA